MNKNQRNENGTNPLHNAQYIGAVFKKQKNHWKYEEKKSKE